MNNVELLRRFQHMSMPLTDREKVKFLEEITNGVRSGVLTTLAQVSEIIAKKFGMGICAGYATDELATAQLALDEACKNLSKE